jgi:Flp pilus assembly protein TadG
LSVVVTFSITFWSINRLRLTGLKRIVREEDGAAYSISLVMVVPIYLYLVCLILETTLMLSAKIGTVYAAYSGARAAAVWSSAANPAQAREHIEQASRQAFVPFASGTMAPKEMGNETAQERRFLDSYTAYAKAPAARAYLAKKYRHSQQAVNVTTNGPPASWDSDITVTVEYQFPFNVPGIGLIMGTKSADGRFVSTIRTTATLQNEGPQNDKQKLGIDYASP